MARIPPTGIFLQGFGQIAPPQANDYHGARVGPQPLGLRVGRGFSEGKNRVRKWLLLMLAAGLFVVAATLIVAQRPVELGLVDGALRRCAEGEPCVNSQLGEGEQRIAPVYVGSDVARAWQELEKILAANPSVTTKVRESHYLQVDWVRSILPYPNDLEFLRFDTGGVIHVRAAARVDWFTFDSHREQVERLRKDLAAAMGTTHGS